MSQLSVTSLRAGSTPQEVITSGRVLQNIASGTITGGLTVGGGLSVTAGTATLRNISPASNRGLGIGTTDIEAWDSSYRAVELGGGGAIMATSSVSDNMYVLANTYFDGAWKYKGADTAQQIGMSSGNIRLMVAPTGAVDGAITWVTALQVDRPTTTNQSCATLAWYDGSTYNTARVLIGTSGTGPGGSGRALYIA